VEEENNTRTILEQVKRIGDHTQALFMLDHHLGERGE
jgi:ferritin